VFHSIVVAVVVAVATSVAIVGVLFTFLRKNCFSDVTQQNTQHTDICSEAIGMKSI